MDTAPVRIAVAGLGTVGAQVVRRLLAGHEQWARRWGRPIRVVAVSARERERERGFPVDGLRWFGSPVDLAAGDGIDVVVELIGGEDGVARDVVETAIAHGRHVVTANKALVASRGAALAAGATAAGRTLAFEAAVAGGVPAIGVLREGLAGADVRAIWGILNGTCNFVLGALEQGTPHRAAVALAQARGFAEADASYDIGGLDAAHKIVILASIAFGAPLGLDGVAVEGIEAITPSDSALARALGFRIRLLAHAGGTPNALIRRVGPFLVPVDSLLARIEGAANAVSFELADADPVTIIGPGAGGAATAGAVLADIAAIVGGRPAPAPEGFRVAPGPDSLSHTAEDACRFYVRVFAEDRPGAMAVITDVLGRGGVSIEQVLQRGNPVADGADNAGPPGCR